MILNNVLRYLDWGGNGRLLDITSGTACLTEQGFYGRGFWQEESSG